MKIAYYGHSSFAAEINGKHLLFDPFITQNPLAEAVDIKRIKADYIFVSHAHLSPIEIKPATDYRNYPASEFYVRCFKERGIFLSNKPDTNQLQRACLEEKCRLTQT